MSLQIKRVVWFGTRLVQSGGGERLSLEVVRALKDQGYEVKYVVYNYDSEKTFEGRYDFLDILRLEEGCERRKFSSPISRRIWLWRRRLWLRSKIKLLKPDIVITTGTWGQVVELYLAIFGLPIKYGVHVFGSLFAFGPDIEQLKYAYIFRGCFSKIRQSVASYIKLIPETRPKMGLWQQFSLEIYALIKRAAIRRAKVVWTLSKRNAWETELLYGRPVRVIKGAFPESIFDFSPRYSLRRDYGLQNRKLVLSICRLVPNKRVDLCLEAFIELARSRTDIDLVIGGTGPEEAILRAIVQSADLENRVHFIGYVPEERLLDYYADSNVVVHLDLADFDIAPLEALAVGARIIWPEEMDLPEITNGSSLVYKVPPHPRVISKMMEIAIDGERDQLKIKEELVTLKKFTWEEFSKKMIMDLNE
jgi:glycosyltransferase involved in cell wall biosynthesis